MLFIFLMFLAGMTYIMIHAIMLGNPLLLVYGVDSWGNVCNQPNIEIKDVALSGRDMTGKKHTFYYNTNVLLSTKENQSSTVLCIRLCPDDSLSTVSEMKSYSTNDDVQLCNYDVVIDNYFDGSSNGLDDCPPLPIVAQKSVLNRCMPKTVSNVLNYVGNAFSNILNAIDSNMLEKMSSDLHATYLEIIYMVLIAFACSIALFILLRYFSYVFIWTVIVAVIAGSIVGTGFCWYSYITFKNTYDSWSSEKKTSSETAKLYGWLGGAICATIVMIIIWLLLLILRKHIALVILLFKEAGKAVISMPLLILEPLWTLIIVGLIVSLLLVIFIYIETAGIPYKDSNGHVKYEGDDQLKYLKWYHLFGFYWIIEFSAACQEIVIAGSIATWFFSRDKENLGWPIFESRKRLLRYHLGSAALGALIIAIVQFVRAVLSFIEARLRGAGSACAVFCLKCFKCCLWCLENVLRFLNRNAYIEIAIYGYSFYKSARRAFKVLLSNALRVLAINSVGDFVLFLAKATVVVVVVVCSIEIFKHRTDVYYTWLPAVLSAVFAYFIASCFLNVYEMAIDTIFLCFCEDSYMNDGITRPYFMSIDLMRFVDNSKGVINVARSRSNKVVPKDGV